MKQCHIFAGSPESTFPNDIDFSDGFVYCADGGYKFVKELGIEPNVLIGDFDTMPEAATTKYKTIKYKAEKDETDTMLCVMDAIKRGYDIINIYGAIGGRCDHAFANIQTLMYILTHNAEGYIYDADNIITMQKAGTRQYKNKNGYYFSLFSYSEEVKNLTIKGTEYEAEKITLKNDFPLGVSNKITSEYATISFDEGILLVIYSRDKIN